MREYTCTDGYGAEEEISASTAEEAAQKYVDGGEWGDECDGAPVYVHVTDEDGDEEWIAVPVYSGEPECAESTTGHEWRDNDDTRGHGGGVTYSETCRRCGLTRHTDTWATDSSGRIYTRITYREE